MDKKIAQKLAALYRRHESLMNLIRALEEYTEQTQAPPSRRPRRARRVAA